MEGVNANVLTNDGLPNSSNCHLHNLLSSHSDLTPPKIAEASASALAAATAAKAARATANEKAAAAAKAIAAAKTALDLVASFPRTETHPVAAPPMLMPNSSSKRVDFSDLGMVLEGPKDGIQVARKRGRPKSK